jgi:hypothetical protein
MFWMIATLSMCSTKARMMPARLDVRGTTVAAHDVVTFGSAEYWLARTRATIATFDAALRERGYQLDADLPIVADLSSAYCYYNPELRTLSMGFPDLHQFFGRMRWMTYLPLFGTNDVEEVARAADLLLPVFAVHEAAHHLRHRHGRMTRDDQWTEEHAANTLTVGYLRTLPSWPAEGSAVLATLDRMRRNAESLQVCEYADALHAELIDVMLYHMHVLDRATYDRAFLAAAARGIAPLRILQESGIVTPAIEAAAEQRQRAARERFNREYGVDFMASTSMAVAQLQVKLVDRSLPSFSKGLADLLGPPTRQPVRGEV